MTYAIMYKVFYTWDQCECTPLSNFKHIFKVKPKHHALLIQCLKGCQHFLQSELNLPCISSEEVVQICLIRNNKRQCQITYVFCSSI